MIIPVSIPSSTALPFKAASIRVDNLTNQWIFIPSLRIYIPPDFFGTILSANAMSQLTVVFEAPPGLVNPAPTAGTIVNVIAHKEPLIDVPGTRRL